MELVKMVDSVAAAVDQYGSTKVPLDTSIDDRLYQFRCRHLEISEIDIISLEPLTEVSMQSKRDFVVARVTRTDSVESDCSIDAASTVTEPVSCCSRSTTQL